MYMYIYIMYTYKKNAPFQCRGEPNKRKSALQKKKRKEKVRQVSVQGDKDDKTKKTIETE